MAEATPTLKSQQESIKEAAKVIQEADALLISTGAGFGVDSGLGTYRGRFSGVWAPLKALGIDYVDATDPSLFRTDPRLAWAYWASSFDQYTNKSTPHEGYTIIKRWARGKKHRLFSITSNIDGHWCRTVGEKSVLEVHGSVTHMQRQDGKKCPVWKTEEAKLKPLLPPAWDLSAGMTVEALIRGGCKDGKDEWVRAVVGEDSCSLFAAEKGKLLSGRQGEKSGAVSTKIRTATGSKVTTVATSHQATAGEPSNVVDDNSTHRKSLQDVKAVRKIGANGERGPDLCRSAEGVPFPTAPAGGDDKDESQIRPNVLMFGDGYWNESRSDVQRSAFESWKEGMGNDVNLAIIEVGAGTTIPTMRFMSEQNFMHYPESSLIRINLDEPEVEDITGTPYVAGRKGIGIGGIGALAALKAIDKAMAHFQRAAKA